MLLESLTILYRLTILMKHFTLKYIFHLQIESLAGWICITNPLKFNLQEVYWIFSRRIFSVGKTCYFGKKIRITGIFPEICIRCSISVCGVSEDDKFKGWKKVIDHNNMHSLHLIPYQSMFLLLLFWEKYTLSPRYWYASVEQYSNICYCFAIGQYCHVLDLLIVPYLDVTGAIQMFEYCPILYVTVSQYLKLIFRKTYEQISRNLKRGIGSLLTPVLTPWAGSHIDHHVWRWVIVLSDLAQSFDVICTHYRYRMITCMPAWFKSTHAKQNCLAGLAAKKSGGTITHLHTWRWDGRHSRFPL